MARQPAGSISDRATRLTTSPISVDTFEEGLTDASAAPAVLSASDLKRLLAQIDRLETASRSTKSASAFYPGTSGNKIHVDDVCMLAGCGRTK